MKDKMLALSLDGIDEYNMYALDMKCIQSLYEDRGDLFACSTLPHTSVSNPMIFGGVENKDKFWVDKERDDSYVDPAAHFDRDKGEPVRGAKGFTRDDYSDESFIWDDLYAAGYDARALQVPIILPPYSYRVKDELDESWFPDHKDRMSKHIRRKPDLIKSEFEDGAEFIASSIQMPDKWLHGIGEDKCSVEWVKGEAQYFDLKIKRLLDYCDNNSISWVIFGDHGSPQPGAMKRSGYLLPRHRTESVIISSEDLQSPTYTDEMYKWMLDLFEADEVGHIVEPEETTDEDEADISEVEERLENLGYK